jgi:hypothetical protein
MSECDVTRDEGNTLLHGGHLELGFTRHGHDPTRSRLVADREDDSTAGSLGDESRREREVARFQRVVGCCRETAWDRLAWEFRQRYLETAGRRIHTFRQ